MSSNLTAPTTFSNTYQIDRAYRGADTPNRQTALNNESAFIGAAQLAWLKRSLLQSAATWKLIASDMPLSVVVKDLSFGPGEIEGKEVYKINVEPQV